MLRPSCNHVYPMAATTSFDLDLVQRYDRLAPRYTSYPTAQQFHAGFDAAAYRRAAFLSNATSSPLSIYVHIPFCKSPCFYCGCNKIITRNHGKARDYIELLRKEIDLQAPLFDGRRVVNQLHFGGGTPTFLDLEELHEVIADLKTRFRLAPDIECSIEVDPRSVSPAGVSGLAQLGFNRMSLGVQDFDPEVQKAVNRVQSYESVASLVAAARDARFASVSFDLIYGLPRQTLESFARTLQQVLEIRPDRIAAYGYAHMPKLFKPQQRIVAAELPSGMLRLELLRVAVDTLTQGGYEYIGMDHFALPQDELSKARHAGSLHRNFQGYSTRAGCDLIGLGVSSISKVSNAYAQNAKNLKSYAAALARDSLPVERGIALTVDDLARAEIIQQLMCQGIVVCEEIEARYALDFAAYFAAELDALGPLCRDGLVTFDGTRIAVTARGQFLLRNIAVIFDRYSNDFTPLSKAV